MPALVVLGMGVMRNFFSPEKTRALLAGKREGVGNVLAASLGNRERDARNTATLQEAGWKIFVVWECETRDHGWHRRTCGIPQGANEFSNQEATTLRAMTSGASTIFIRHRPIDLI